MTYKVQYYNKVDLVSPISICEYRLDQEAKISKDNIPNCQDQLISKNHGIIVYLNGILFMRYVDSNFYIYHKCKPHSQYPALNCWFLTGNTWILFQKKDGINSITLSDVNYVSEEYNIPPGDGVYTLGNNSISDNIVITNDPYIEEKQCLLTVAGNNLLIMDEGKSNTGSKTHLWKVANDCPLSLNPDENIFRIGVSTYIKVIINQ